MSGGDIFGRSVSISGNYAIVGSPQDNDNGNNSGVAYIFERDASGNWNQNSKIIADEPSNDDFFDEVLLLVEITLSWGHMAMMIKVKMLELRIFLD